MPHRFRGLPLPPKVDTLKTEVRSDQDFVVLRDSKNGTIVPNPRDYRARGRFVRGLAANARDEFSLR
jgi:hypothetical protein